MRRNNLIKLFTHKQGGHESSSRSIPLILISGIMCNENLWKKIRAMLPNTTRIYIPDVTKKKSIIDLSSEIIANNESKFNLVGFSSGGYIAQEIIHQAPNIVNKLILMSTSGGNYSKKQQGMRREFIDICERDGAVVGLTAFIDKLNSTYIGSNQKTVNDNSYMMKEIDTDVFVRQFKAVYEYNQALPRLENIKCPTVIVSADDDPFITKEAYVEMATSIPNVTLRIIHGAGHMLPLSQPEEVSSIIAEFFEYPRYIKGRRLD